MDRSCTPANTNLKNVEPVLIWYSMRLTSNVGIDASDPVIVDQYGAKAVHIWEIFDLYYLIVS